MATLDRPAGSRGTSNQVGRAPSLFVGWLLLVGVLFPGGFFATTAAGPKLTVGRVAVLLLLIPAFVKLLKGYRRLIAADYLMVLTAIWMISVAAYTGGSDSLSSAMAEAIEYAGGYFVARGLFAGPAGAAVFVRALKGIIVIVVLLGVVDTASGRLIVHETLARMANTGPFLIPDFRMHLVRAASTFDHPILFGTFCMISAIILMGSETDPTKWIVWVGIASFGCFLALSSAPLLSLTIGFGTFAYDRTMQQFPWRWRLLWTFVAVLILLAFVVANHPVGWIISHLTFEPESGYFRLIIWDRATARIAEQPITGFAFNLLGDYILDYTVDSVWLVMALRFGLPMVAMLILVNLSTVVGSRARVRGSRNSDVAHLTWGFSAAVVMYMLTGFTVHYWHFVWIFWGLCLGVRGSLREFALGEARSRAAVPMRFAEPIGDFSHVQTFGRP